jgi:primosomal protein N' (replication factor Y)
MVQLRLLGRDPARTRRAAETLGAVCRAAQAQTEGLARAVEIMGPIEAAVARIAGSYRWQVLLKSPSAARLHRLMERVLAERRRLEGPHVRLIIDFDPVFLM